MVDHARQDLPEVELAADVGGDAAERLRPVELHGGGRAEPLGMDGQAELAGDRDEERLQLGQRCRRHRVGGDQDAPRSAHVRDGDGDPGGHPAAADQPVRALGGRLAHRARRGNGAAGQASMFRDPPDVPGAFAAGCGRHEAPVAALQDRRQVMTATTVQEVDGRAEDLGERAVRGDEVREPPEDVDLDDAPLHLEGRRQRRGEQGGLRRPITGEDRSRRDGQAVGLAGRGTRLRRRSLARPRPQLDDVGAERRDR